MRRYRISVAAIQYNNNTQTHTHDCDFRHPFQTNIVFIEYMVRKKTHRNTRTKRMKNYFNLLTNSCRWAIAAAAVPFPKQRQLKLYLLWNDMVFIVVAHHYSPIERIRKLSLSSSRLRNAASVLYLYIFAFIIRRVDVKWKYNSLIRCCCC